MYVSSYIHTFIRKETHQILIRDGRFKLEILQSSGNDAMTDRGCQTCCCRKLCRKCGGCGTENGTSELNFGLLKGYTRCDGVNYVHSKQQNVPFLNCIGQSCGTSIRTHSCNLPSATACRIEEMNTKSRIFFSMWN